MSKEKEVAPEIRARVLHGTNLSKFFHARTLLHPTKLNYPATLTPVVLNILWKRAVGWGCGLARPHSHYHHGSDHRMYDRHDLHSGKYK
jgi:hypothetical protein